ncbi:MAG TPA: mechanosensitive ion channel domain-containing protein [Streptosporangiaceae bacterium]|jgi:small conductance mechanosensitive channel
MGLADAHHPLHGVGAWASNNLLQAVLLVTGTILLTRFANWLRGRITDRIDARANSTDALVRSEALKYRHSITQVITWTALVVIYCVVAVLTFQRLGFPLSGFIAPASVAAVALGFGAQRIVQDILSGFLIVTERQYGYGDIVTLNTTTSTATATGTVEEVTLRITRIRSLNGEVITTPNGQIVQVTNLSRDWARVVVDVPVPVNVDLNHVTDILRRICAEIYLDEQMKPLLLDSPSVMGVESLEMDHFNLRVVARTLPGKQFDVGRALRARITLVFLQEGITLHASLDAAEPSGTS